MPTIIERIAAAEADAEALKRNAQEAARSAEAAAALKNAREEAKAGLALAAAMAEREAGAEAERLLEKSSLDAEAVIREAGKNLSAASDMIVDHILNKL